MSNAATLHRRYLEAAIARDFDAIRKLYHPDFVYMSGNGVEQKGAEAGIAVVDTYTTAFPDLRFDIRHQFAPDFETSIIEFTAYGTHRAELEGIPATGKTVEVVVCNIIEARDEKIYREREYYDGLSLMQQLGVIQP